MKENWLENLESNLPNFLSKLTKQEHTYQAVVEGNTNEGKNLNLGLSCYALKIFYITNLWDKLDKEKQKKWIDYINSFQSNSNNFPDNSYIDTKYLEYFSKLNPSKWIKNFTKKMLNKYTNQNFLLDDLKLENFIRAETKQAISTLHQVNEKNKKPYNMFPKTEKEVFNYLENLDWSKPWNAGAQYAALCVFVSTQISSKDEKEKLINILEKFILTITQEDTGTFYKGNKPSDVEIVNGAMKVITGLDWIGVKIPYPENLLKTFLRIDPNDDGCDLVDIVYVIYMCQKSINYKEEDIKLFCKNILNKIENHYFYNEGGFSYFINKSQTHYYGVKITKGLNEPDLHGTLLLVWAISMIAEIIDIPIKNWKVLKP